MSLCKYLCSCSRPQGVFAKQVLRFCYEACDGIEFLWSCFCICLSLPQKGSCLSLQWELIMSINWMETWPQPHLSLFQLYLHLASELRDDHQHAAATVWHEAEREAGRKVSSTQDSWTHEVSRVDWEEVAGFVGFHVKSVALGINCKVSAVFTDSVFQKFSYSPVGFAMVFVLPFRYRSLTVIFKTVLLSVASLITMCMQCPLCLNLV